jgi:SNF2 family DNA or RNA helicase
VHQVDVSDLMRRMVKEKLLKFDGRPLFPERIAYTVPYHLSDPEARLYREVTEYVREEFNRAEALRNDKRAGTVGFALTILQRRLASSPEAIHQSLRRRRERLEGRLRELELLRRGAAAPIDTGPSLDADDIEDLEDAPENEIEAAEEAILDEATAASTIAELRAEIATLARLEALAAEIRRKGEDTKWSELARVLGEVFTPAGLAGEVSESDAPYGSGPIPKPVPSPAQKLVVFTEHRDTLNYLERRIASLLGRPGAVVTIHGGMGREERRKSKERFLHDPEVQVLAATDAAGEGINLQWAHLMVNYDLPWNPNRIEQRFGRIHRPRETAGRFPGGCFTWRRTPPGGRATPATRPISTTGPSPRTSPTWLPSWPAPNAPGSTPLWSGRPRATPSRRWCPNISPRCGAVASNGSRRPAPR